VSARKARAFLPLAWLFAATVVSVASGCGSSGRADDNNDFVLHPVKGRVLQDDGSPFVGGHIRFLPVTAPNYVAAGDINPSGEFILRMDQMGVDKGPGAPEGAYSVSVRPAGAAGNMAYVMAQGTYTVKAGDNAFTIKLSPMAALELPPRKDPPAKAER